MEGDKSLVNVLLRFVCFNSRPRVEGDQNSIYRTTSPLLVSIHALAWRATPLEGYINNNYTVSIHALAWRATYMKERHVDDDNVSIHALAWRATFFAPPIFQTLKSFNSRPRVEGDGNYIQFYLPCITVQSAYYTIEYNFRKDISLFRQKYCVQTVFFCTNPPGKQWVIVVRA